MVDVECGLEALLSAAARLLELDPGRFMRVLALCRAYLAVYEQPDEGLPELLASCEMIAGNDKHSA
jgi:hypothetical protein